MGSKNKIRIIKQAILSAGDDMSLMDIIKQSALEFNGARMLYSTNAAGAQLQVKDSHKHVFAGIFSKNRLLAYSDQIMEEMKSGEAVIMYKKRVLLDTNLISNLPKYFLGEDLDQKELIDDILSFIKTDYGGGFDFTFPIFENLREFCKENNPHPARKVAAAMYFDHLLRGEHKDSADIFEPYYESAECLWKDFRSSKDAWNLIDNRDLIYAVLLKAFHICWTNKGTTIENLLHTLVDHCLTRFGVLPLKELYFSWKLIIGFSTGYYAPIFDEPDLKSPKKDSLNRIAAAAWDLFIFRYIETLLTEERGNSFYIPTVTTLDKGLLKTINSCPIRAMISFEHLQFVETIFEDELLFQQCLDASLSHKQKNMLMDIDRDLKGGRKPRHEVSISIFETEKLIKKFL